MQIDDYDRVFLSQLRRFRLGSLARLLYRRSSGWLYGASRPSAHSSDLNLGNNRPRQNSAMHVALLVTAARTESLYP